ncbi:uncharacterized protein LOC142358271 [Convolutriloba macropyga]|uniref:uncharacterized protein LOC142358271 n=1 Tax=Convolutriloba macropyga TaxID=536237 RepID=UPI003F52414D
MSSSTLEDTICQFVNLIKESVIFVGLLSFVFVFIVSIFSIVAIAKTFYKQRNSMTTLLLLVSNVVIFCVFLEGCLIGVLCNAAYQMNGSKIYLPLLIIGVCQLCELETICVFLVLAIQRFLSWQKPIMFMNQSKLTLIGQFVGIIVLCHVLVLVPIVPIIVNVPEHHWLDIFFHLPQSFSLVDKIWFHYHM